MSGEELLKLDVGQEGEGFPVAGLIGLGEEKGYVTIEDILELFPEAEEDVDQLEIAFAALLSAGIPYVDDDTAIEPTDKDLLIEIEEAKEAEADLEDQYLADIDAGDIIGLYLKEASRVPLLNFEEEVELAQTIEAGSMARQDIFKNVGSMSDEERAEYRARIKAGSAAMEHLITANARLVISVAKKYMGRGIPFLDLIQEGNIGLMRAAKKFDWRRGHKFSTYATWWIRQAVTRAIADQGRTIRVPVHMSDQINKLLRVQHGLTQKLGRDPTVEELAERLDVPAKKVEHMIEISRRPVSLETPTDDEEDSVLGDFVRDKSGPSPDDEATYNLLKKHMKEVVDALPPREMRVLQLRYGLLDGQAYTLEKVGQKMGVTRERIRQIENQALSRLRHPIVKRKLGGYLGEPGSTIGRPKRRIGRPKKGRRGSSSSEVATRVVKERNLLEYCREKVSGSVNPFITQQIEKVGQGWTVEQVERALKNLSGDYPVMLKCLLGVGGFKVHSLKGVAKVFGQKDVEEVRSEFEKALILLQDELKGPRRFR